MNINKVSNINFCAKPIIVNGKKLVPLSEFQGPILKLTKADEKKIEILRAQLNALENDYGAILRYINVRRNINHMKNHYAKKLAEISKKKEAILSEIENVKIARYKKMTENV